MERWKQEYNQMKAPEHLKKEMEVSIMKAKSKKKRMRRVLVGCAAVLAIVLLLPNTSAQVAAAMQDLPIVGGFFKVVTVREYQVDEERNMADVKVPEVVLEETPQTESTEEASGAEDEADTAEQAQQSVDEINLDIQQVTDELINEFKENMEAESYQDIMIDSQVMTDDDHWFSLDLLLYQGAGSGYEEHHHYTIDKTTGKRAELSDFYGEDYVEIVTEEVKKQMREQMAEDESVLYWVDYDEVPDWNFQEIKEDQDFYVNSDGKVVICFNEYEVAPGYMGYLEFVMEI